MKENRESEYFLAVFLILCGCLNATFCRQKVVFTIVECY